MSVLKKVLRQWFSSGESEPDQSPLAKETDNFILDDNFGFDSVPPCPACASNNVAIFVYGKPRLSRIIVEGFESGKIISGGCMIRKTAPKWHCYNCNKDFGRLR
ncbi:MAG: hypothetical protein GQ563_04195 [Desulfuromusa sp.]|nr:hypothetical protein [Desulfuromusa sp.]